MPKSSRTGRIADVIHRHIARLLHKEFKDPRIGMVTIQSVDISPDLSNAKIFVTVLQHDKIEETIYILNKASGFFRGELSRLMHLRTIPKPQFIYDESVVRSGRLTRILEELSEKSKHSPKYRSEKDDLS